MMTQAKRIVCCSCFLLGIGIYAASAIEDSLVLALKSDTLDSALHTRIAHFSCENVGAVVLSHKLGRETGIAMGIVAATKRGPPYPTVSLDMRNATPAEILDEIVLQDPRYIWVPVKGNYVNILPVQSVEDDDSWINKPAGQGGTLLDLRNHVSIEAGPDACWTVSGKFESHSSIDLSKIQTTALAEAEQLAKSYGSRSQAIASYAAAFEDAPFVNLKAVAILKMAEIHLDPQFASSSVNPKAAVQLYKSLLDADLPGGSRLYAREEFVRRYSSALFASGRGDDAEDFLLNAIDSPSLTERLGRYTLRNALMMYDVAAVDFRTALIYLERKRRLLPSDEAFQNELKDYLKTARINAKEEAKWKNIKPGTLVKTSSSNHDSEAPNE